MFAKKIDIHSHVTMWPNTSPPLRGSGKPLLSVEDQFRMWDEINVQHGVLLPLVSLEARRTLVTPEECHWLATQYPDRFSWFCSIDPRCERNLSDSDLSCLIEHYKKLGARGVGEITSNLYADDPKMDNMFYHCAACDMPVLIHIAPKPDGYYGIIDDPGLPRIEKMLKKHPNLKLIGHSASFWSEIGEYDPAQRNGYPTGKVIEGRMPKLMREYGNLYCDLSAGSGSNALMRDPEYAASFITEFADRIYFGCDLCSPDATFHLKFAQFLQDLADTGAISQEVYRKICWDNAAKLLDLQA